MLMPKRVKYRRVQRGRMKGVATRGNTVSNGSYGLVALEPARMGSGKGTPEYWVAVVKPGRVLFEMDGVTEDIAKEAMRLASHKLPIKCKFVKKEEL